VPYAEVGCQERIGISQRTHGHVIGCPLADPGQREQPCPSLLTVRANVERQMPVAERGRNSDERPSPGVRHSEPPRIGGRQRCGTREHARDRAAWTLQRLAVLRGKPACERGGTLQRNLLSEHRSDRKLVSVDVSRHAKPWCSADEMTERVVSDEHIEHGLGIGVKVEECAAAVNGCPKVSQVMQHEARRNMSCVRSKVELNEPSTMR
jgi:hypothetical protein